MKVEEEEEPGAGIVEAGLRSRVRSR